MVLPVSKLLEKIVSRFPPKLSYAFAYGSSVFPQTTETFSEENMIDFIFVVDDPSEWHKANLLINSKHYSLVKFAGAEFIRNLQEGFGAKIYFNTLVEIENRLIKYGVISTNHLIEDLLDWQTLYTSGRLHKPVKIIQKPQNADLKRALSINIESALHTSLLCLPERFSEEELYMRIAGLSYNGDFRMHFGEDKRKIENIVKNQIPYFQNLYSDHLKTMPLLHWKQSQSVIEQDCSYETTLYHLNLLPKAVQHNLLVRWNGGGQYKDVEDVLQSLACDAECCGMVERAVQKIVWWSSLTQTAKGILTAGVVKSMKYSSRKLKKMFKSVSK